MAFKKRLSLLSGKSSGYISKCRWPLFSTAAFTSSLEASWKSPFPLVYLTLIEG